MNKFILSVLLVSFLSVSCSKDEIKIDPDNLLLGTWNYSEYQNDASVFIRSSEFANNPGYKFSSDGTLVERKNTGWCGTPPVSYGDYTGTWSVLNDTLIEINTTYWGGEITYKLDIQSVNSNTLKVVTIYQNW